MSTESIDHFMSWLDMIIKEKIEEYETDDEVEELPTHEINEHIGMIRMLKIVKGKALELGWITPNIREGSLDDFKKE